MDNCPSYNFSIIIPHYNIPNLLGRCLSSIPRRDDIQIIVVDDNSDPSVVDFNHFPYRDDARVTYVFSKEGKGAGAARNMGLKVALGKWILFIDADDYLVDNPVQLWDAHLHSDMDVIYFNITSSDCDTMVEANRHYDKRQAINRLKGNRWQLERYLRFKYTEPWGKLYSREFLTRENIVFQESHVANDYMFSIRCGLLAKNIMYDNGVFYCVTVRRDSLSHSMFSSSKKIYSRIKVYAEIQKLFQANKIGLYPLYSFVGQTLLRSTVGLSEIRTFLRTLGYSRPHIFRGMFLSVWSSVKNKIVQFLNLPYCSF